MSSCHELRVLYWNADGVHKKQQELADLAVNRLNVDIIAVCETRLTYRLTLNIPGFVCYRRDKHRDSIGQGVALIVRSDLAHSLIQSPHTQNLEAVGISLNLTNGNVKIFSVYQSPNLPLIASDLDSIMSSGPKVLAMGDMNSKHPLWSPGPSNTRGIKLYEHMLSSEYIVHAPLEPTLVHYCADYSPSIPDIILCKNFNPPCDISTISALSSNHLPVFTKFTSKTNRIPLHKFNYAKADWVKYRNLLNLNTKISSNVYKSANEIDSTITDFQSLLLETRDICVPFSSFKPWCSSLLPRCIKRLIKEKNRLRRFAIKESNIIMRKTLNNKITLLKFQIVQAIKLHIDKAWTNKLNRVDNPGNDLWRLVKSLRSTSTAIPALKSLDGSLTTSQQDQCDVLAESFLKNMLLTHDWHSDELPAIQHSLSLINGQTDPNERIMLVRPSEVKKCITALKLRKAPGPDEISNILIKNLPQKCIVLLTKIFNACLALTYFPSPWKVAKVIAVPKPGKDLSDPTSYRPISLLPCLGKLFEKIIYKRLLLASDNLLINEQFGFRHSHSTVQQLARVAETVSHNLNLKQSTGMFLLDIEKAFDTVWHEALLHKMVSDGVSIPLVKMIQSYLSNRSFSVHINNYSSPPKPVPAGVPQGSIVGPVLFLDYLNDIPVQPRTNIACFADDTASFTSSSDIDLVIGRLQLSVELLLAYFTKWKLKINTSKTEAIMFTRKRTPPSRTLKIGNHSIAWSRSVKYLGTTLDTKLNWTENISKLSVKGAKALNALNPVLNRRSCLSSETKLRIYRTLVRPCITYACPVWSSTCKTNINKLQVIQNKALKYAFQTPFCTNLQKLHRKIGLPRIDAYIYNLSEKFYLHKNPTNKNPLIKNLCKTRSTNLTFIDKYNRYKLPHHLFLKRDE